MGNFSGALVKMDEKLQKRPLEFNKDFCPECCEVMLNLLVTFKEEHAKNQHTGELPKQAVPEGSNNGAE